ncbi:transketolase [Enorma phocaeensis]|uniref:transketolase n=1 Tax=Enorma phocaeensis TaxID=1871019 RepID=UPI000C853F57|nr:transketolase [Enorma phocaeensis]
MEAVPDGSVRDLRLAANDMRVDVVSMIARAGSGHPGGSLSCVDILAALYLGGVLRIDVDDPDWSERDLFFLSKGHAAPALYATLHRLGWIDDEDVASLRTLGGKLQGHPDSNACPGVEVCSGSLGQGLPIAVGAAWALKGKATEGRSSERSVYVLVGDGELQEGSNWEALMLGAHHRLDNLTLIVDQNRLELDTAVDSECTLGDLRQKLEAFGWCVFEVDGHDIEGLLGTLRSARRVRDTRPRAIISHTVKGKGVSFMEDNVSWHGGAPNSAQAEQALAELAAEREAMERGEGNE